MRSIYRGLVALVVAGLLAGCSKGDGTPPRQKAVRVSATGAYETYFGPAPTTEKGSCYAFVVYFPSARVPGKAVPLPFFAFDQASLKKVALERLMIGMTEQSYRGEVRQLFPPNARLLSVQESRGTVTADFGPEVKPAAADPGRLRALTDAVTLTLTQFDGVESVVLKIGGSPLDAGRPAPGAASVLEPSPPRLLKVVAMKEKSAEPVSEVDALFDRPVDIGEFRFETADGAPLAGEVYHSMFDMAAVLKPKEPERLAGAPRVKVRWKVVDKVGRSAAGEGLVPLEVQLHRD